MKQRALENERRAIDDARRSVDEKAQQVGVAPTPPPPQLFVRVFPKYSGVQRRFETESI